jgi:Protein of unknown function (DUF2752)
MRAAPGMAGGLAAPRGGRAFGHAEVFAAIAALSFLAARFLPLLALPYACPLRALAGVPCPTCGMTHAFVHLAHGELRAALRASPAGAALAALAWLLPPLDLLRLALGRPLPAVGPRAARALALGAGLVLLASWAFLVVAHRA